MIDFSFIERNQKKETLLALLYLGQKILKALDLVLDLGGDGLVEVHQEDT